MKIACWKCGGTGKNHDPNVTAISICSVCGGTGVLDDLVYQPTVRYFQVIEPVAISKTETTSARSLSCWYCTEIEKHGVVTVKTVLDKSGRELDAYKTPYNYCPACGRKLD